MEFIVRRTFEASDHRKFRWQALVEPKESWDGSRRRIYARTRLGLYVLVWLYCREAKKEHERSKSKSWTVRV